MTINEALAILANVAVIASVGALIYQLRELRRQVALSNNIAKGEGLHQITAHGLTFAGHAISDPELVRLWYSGGDGLTLEDKNRYREMLIAWLIMMENVFYQQRLGLIPEDVGPIWLPRTIRSAVHRHDFSVLGVPIEEFFPGPFGEFLASTEVEMLTTEAEG